MVATPEKVNVLLSIAGLLLLWAVWSFGLRPALIDTFRQSVFEIRDEMFDYAAKGNISFNHPAYGTTRTLMNGYIRFAHRIDSALMLIFIVYFIFRKSEVEKERKEWQEKMESQLSSLPEDQRRALNAYIQRTQIELGKYVLYGSPLLVAVALPFVVVVAVSLLFRKLVGHVSVKEKFQDTKDACAGLLDHRAFSEAKRGHTAVA